MAYRIILGANFSYHKPRNNLHSHVSMLQFRNEHGHSLLVSCILISKFLNQLRFLFFRHKIDKKNQKRRGHHRKPSR